MAEIKIEKKKSVWPLIIAAIVVVLLVWALLAMRGRDTAGTAATSGTAAVAPVATDATTDAARGTMPSTAPGTRDAPAGPTTPEQRDAALDRYAGTYGGGNIQLELSSAGTYTMRDSPAGEGRGRWSYDDSASVLHLTPGDGSQDRYFRVEGTDTLTPLDPEGDPAAQMAPLQRVVDR